MKKMIFAILCISIICGCGTSYMVKSVDKPTITPKADSATLVIIRELCFYGGGVLFTNYLDRKLIGETLGCTFFITEVPPGPHYVISTAENTGVAHFDFKPHKVYYLGQSIVPGLLRGRTGGFYPMTLQQAEDAMNKSTYFRIDPKANAKDLDAEVYEDAVAGYERGIKDHPEAYKELLVYDGQYTYQPKEFPSSTSTSIDPPVEIPTHSNSKVGKDEAPAQLVSFHKRNLAILPLNASKNYNGVAAQYYSTTKGAVIEKLKNLPTNNQEFKYTYNYYVSGGDSSFSKLSSEMLSEDHINTLWVRKSTFSDLRELNTDFAIEIGRKLNADLVLTCALLGESIRVFIIDVGTKIVSQKSYSYGAWSGYTAAPTSLDDFLTKYITNQLK